MGSIPKHQEIHLGVDSVLLSTKSLSVRCRRGTGLGARELGLPEAALLVGWVDGPPGSGPLMLASDETRGQPRAQGMPRRKAQDSTVLVLSDCCSKNTIKWATYKQQKFYFS